jgi:uncharacterized protein YlzI (FlbEa/FlbD family)|tara:strand:- start:173 stop:580 length:408 start_codon:yes stop_codon:yes gene_type:complete
MKKSIYFLALLIAPLIVTACSRSSEKEIVTVPTVVETPKIELPQIRIVSRPSPIKMKNSDIIVVTESNLEEVINRVKNTQGEFVLYAMTAQSFESLALNFEQIKQFIETQNQIILYYEKAVKKEPDNTIVERTLE